MAEELQPRRVYVLKKGHGTTEIVGAFFEEPEMRRVYKILGSPAGYRAFSRKVNPSHHLYQMALEWEGVKGEGDALSLDRDDELDLVD